ncbi:leishmanolysin [Prunus yedoensis var. nudiflora]|uniref:Leishmanolysin n=1 Tax=Prunus yedoensis var. nudiflora TaxID=2094558 RepID=A0A314Z5Z5_PRUYE|nr:leishmanolysin [Prunus yedoensis var. nudiflora]
MTLALLEDSGWYQANYSMADHLDWGRNQGTEFVTSPCNLWKGAYHCNTTQLSGCTYNREAECTTPDRMLGEVRGSNSRCMASSLVRTGFVRGSMTQGNGCYQHRCVNNSLEVAVDGMWKVCPETGGPLQFPGFNGELLCPAYHELCSTSLVPATGQCPKSCHFNGDCVEGRTCPSNCSGRGNCLSNGLCECRNGYTGIDCSTAVCDEQCSLHGGVCDDGVCEFRCSDYAGYSCQNSTMLQSSLKVCKDVLENVNSGAGQHCAPSEPSILQQLEDVVVMPNYHRLFPGGARKLFSIFGTSYCDMTAKQLACWISIQKCDKDGDNRLRVCYSACQSYNSACGASLDCSDQTLFSSKDEAEGQCTGSSEMKTSWISSIYSLFSSNSTSKGASVKNRQL